MKLEQVSSWENNGKLLELLALLFFFFFSSFISEIVSHGTQQ